MIDNKKISNIRSKYSQKGLNKSEINPDPFVQFSIWMDEILKLDVSEPNAMVLSTSGKGNIPSSRVVLLKEITNDGFIFFTNYESRKSKELNENPNAALLFYWKELGRQVRIIGSVGKISYEESEKYFKMRPYESRISAWASYQSSIIQSRKFLEEKVHEFELKFKDEVPLPEFWGGYKLIPVSFEFWQGRENRLHDRIFYSKKNNNWKIERLAP